MNKKSTRVLLLGAALCALVVAWYLLSPLWKIVIVNDPSPLERIDGQVVSAEKIIDASTTMDAATKAALDAAMADMNKEDAVIVLDTPPTQPLLVAAGGFVGAAHDVRGIAKVITDDNKKILRFESFNTLNGPDVRVYLATDTTDTRYIDLGPIKATRGNINYQIDPKIDLEKYDHVLIWCKDFSVLFGYAELLPVAE